MKTFTCSYCKNVYLKDRVYSYTYKGKNKSFPKILCSGCMIRLNNFKRIDYSDFYVNPLGWSLEERGKVAILSVILGGAILAFLYAIR